MGKSVPSLLLALSLLLAAAPALALPDISGHWAGAWSCDSLPCKGKKGPMTAQLKQKEDGTLTGTASMTGLSESGTGCVLEHSSIIGERAIIGLRCGVYRLSLNGLLENGALRGTFDGGSLGSGMYRIERTGK